MVEAAILQGFDSIGFSGHAYVPFSSVYCMDKRKTEAYIEHITKLKQAYKGKLSIFLGTESDIYSQIQPERYDYIIGSVHYLPVGDNCLGFDYDAATVRRIIDQWFDGDGMAYAKRYFETLATMPQHGKFDIIGHADILCKHAETEVFFDRCSDEYRRWACEALDALVGAVPYFEVNSGAIARGYRTTPYPDPFLLDEFKKRGFGAVITSDCHQCKNLSCNYEASQKLLWDHGFREIYILTEDGFRPETL